MAKQRISFLHIAPEVGQVNDNRRLVESAVKVAAAEGADWALTPELCIPGYLFAEKIGWTRARLNELINGKRGITADAALDLAEVLGTTAKLWMNLQATYELDRARKRREQVA